MKKKTLFILFALFIFLLIIILLILTYLSLIQKGNSNVGNNKITNTPTTIPTQKDIFVDTSTPSITPTTQTQVWETFNYDFIDFEPKFSIDYPADWEALIDYESSGGNDVRLFKNGKSIHFDASALGSYPPEEILKFFVTNGGSYDFEFTTTLLNTGYLDTDSFPDNAPYSIFRLNHNTNELVNYAIIAQPYTLTGSKGYLFIWDQSGQDLQLIKEMLESLKVIP